MALGVATARKDYTGTGGTSVYPYPFLIFDKAHLTVIKVDLSDVETTLVVDVDYTVSGVGEASGGNVTLLAGNLPLNFGLHILRIVPLLQTFDIKNLGRFDAVSHENAYDTLTMMSQQHQDALNRSIHLPSVVDPATVDTELPLPTANSAIRWNATANGLENFVLASQGAYVFPGGTGIPDQTAALTAVARSVTGDVGVAITDGNGVSGNPVVGLDVAMCQGRLTLHTTDPVPAADQTNKTTLYLLPYRGDKASVYDVALSKWVIQTIPAAGRSVAVPATTDTMYDVFLRVDGALILVAWTNDTTRATALTLTAGAYTDSGGKLYLGSFRTTGVSGRAEDSVIKRHVWNYWNRIERHMLVQEATASWTYTTDTFRQANAAATNQLDFLIGLDEDAVKARVSANYENTSAGVTASVGVGIDSTSVNDATLRSSCQTDVANQQDALGAEYVGRIGAVGRHTLVWLERSAATGTGTWSGFNSKVQSGICGTVMA